MTHIALPDRLVFSFVDVVTRRNGPRSSFVAELFYLSSTLPAGSVRVMLREVGLEETVIGAFVGNENLKDAGDDVELLVCAVSWSGGVVGGVCYCDSPCAFAVIALCVADLAPMSCCYPCAYLHKYYVIYYRYPAYLWMYAVGTHAVSV